MVVLFGFAGTGMATGSAGAAFGDGTTSMGAFATGVTRSATTVASSCFSNAGAVAAAARVTDSTDSVVFNTAAIENGIGSGLVVAAMSGGPGIAGTFASSAATG
jgi:phosphosulfolactate phosphohydrolase-like enzyme